MEVKEVRELYFKLPTESKIVEVYYKNKDDKREARPGYLIDVFDTPLKEIPEQWRGNYGEGKEHPLPPFIRLGTMLDRNQVPVNAVEIRLEDIITIRPVAVVSLRTKIKH